MTELGQPEEDFLSKEKGIRIKRGWYEYQYPRAQVPVVWLPLLGCSISDASDHCSGFNSSTNLDRVDLRGLC